MKRSSLVLVIVLCVGVQQAPCQEPLREQAARTLARATAFLRGISTNGGYVGIYSLDLKRRYGEATYQPVKATRIWVQPPGTPTVGQTFLAAYRATGDREYLSAAREVGRALAWGQNANGGWRYLADVSALKPDSARAVRRKGTSTFDDNTSQAAVAFLMDLDQVLDEAWLDEAVKLALGFMIHSQFPNGAWPQRYPPGRGYGGYYTFNDNAINDCIRVMLRAHELYKRAEHLAGARRGGDFLILSQIPAPQSGWAQQYSHDLKPAWARSFEPPGVCSAVTARNIRTLVDLYLYTRDAKYLKPIPAAIRWLEKSKLKPGLWARLYEMKTNRPIYGDRDGKIHYTLEEISAERVKGYSWRSSYGVPAAIRLYEEVKKLGAEAYLARRDPKPSASQRRRAARSLETRVREVIAALDAKGRWPDRKRITTALFVRNAAVLTRYLELTRSTEPPAPASLK